MHSHSRFLLALRDRLGLRPPRLFGSLRSPATAGIYGELRRTIYEPSTNHLRRVKGFLTPSLDFARDKSFNCSIFPVITATWLLSFDGLSSRLSKHFAKHQRHRLSKPPFSFLTNREVAFHVGKLLLS